MRAHTRILAGSLAALLVVSASAPQRFDGRLWKVGNDSSDRQQHITEYVVPPEQVESWTELVTHQVIFDPSHRLPLDKLLELTRAGFGPDCKNFKFSVLQGTATAIVYEWSHDGCADYPAQFETSRMAACAEGICRWAYSTKRVPAAPATVARWRKIVSGLDSSTAP